MKMSLYILLADANKKLSEKRFKSYEDYKTLRVLSIKAYLNRDEHTLMAIYQYLSELDE